MGCCQQWRSKWCPEAYGNLVGYWYLKWTWETHPWLKGKFHLPKASHIRHGLLTRSGHLCHERPALTHPLGEPSPKWDPRCPVPPWPRSSLLPPAKPTQPQNLLQSPNPCSLLTAVSHQKGLKEEKGCSQGWVNLSGRMRVAQSHRTLMWDLKVAGRSAGSLPMPCCWLSCSHSTACRCWSRS